MPAERTKSWKQTDSACNQLVWTAPVANYESAYITEVDATVDFDNDGPPPLVDAPPPPPGQFILFPPADEKSVVRRAPHSKKKPENHIPRPPNAFILFRSSFIKGRHVSTEVETNHSTLSKIIGITWKNMSESERQVWHAKAKIEQEEHRRKFPKYAFRPQQTKGKGGTGEKRKVREVEPKDLRRCEKIAQLLVEGKKGKELKAEIQEFDKNHVPQIIARFEAPITARAFRRSSSAPILDTEASLANQSFLPTSPAIAPARTIRSLSARPTRYSTPELPVVEVQGQMAQSSPNAEVQPAPLKQEPAFDFSSFSFESGGSPASSFGCDPLSEGIDESFSTPNYGTGLTIDTSFMNDWSQCSSPVSPEASSDFFSSPSPSPSYASDVHPFEQGLEKPFDAYAQAFPVYQQNPMGSLCGDGFLGVDGSDFATFVNPSAPFSQLDMEFASFMSSVPQYAFCQ